MVDQVTFPTSIGGSGKTYTNDANPETGMFNGGHRINFFPILSDAVAAAGYVSQYAQAINGAKANADKAEDARGYVEAVANQYNVNITQQFRDKATIDLNFALGRYSLDDGERTEITDAGSFLSVVRASPKWVEGPGGKLREVPINTLARQWLQGIKQGALIEDSSTNELLNSEQIDGAAWVKSGVSITANDTVAPNGATTADLVLMTGSAPGLISQQLSPISGYTTASVYVKKHSSSEVTLNPFEVGFEAANLTFSFDNETVSGAPGGVEKLANGWFRLFMFLEEMPGLDAFQFRVWPRNRSQPAAAGVGCYVWGAQLEKTAHLTSYIPTTTTKVTRAADDIYRSLGGEFNADEGTIFGHSFGFTRPKFGEPAKSLGSLSSSGAPSEYINMRVTDSDFVVEYRSSATVISAIPWRFEDVGYPEDGVKFAISFSKDGGFVSVNGNTKSFNTSGIVPAVTRFTAGSGVTSKVGNGLVENLYIPKHFTAAELSALTAL